MMPCRQSLVSQKPSLRNRFQTLAPRGRMTLPHLCRCSRFSLLHCLPRLSCLVALAIAALILPGLAAAQSQLQVHIDMRAEIAAGRFDPLTDRVGLRGAAAPLSWDRSTLAAPDAAQAGTYSLSLQFDSTPAQPLTYKFKVERPGRADEGWEAGGNRSLALRAGAQSLAREWGSQTEPLAPQRTGRIDRIAPLPSAFVAPREVQVWLPPGYAQDANRRYPVLYLHDGQNVFDALAAGAEWQLDETAQRLVLAGEVAPFIMVAVASTDSRGMDYTPVPGRWQGQALGGGAPAYARYLLQELKPLIDARYRTQPGRDSTSVGGSSLGGLVSMWLLLAHGDSFGAALVVSPSVWWAGEDILRQVRQHSPPLGLTSPRIWLDIGEREGAQPLAGVRRLRQTLLDLGWPATYLEQPGAGHDEAAWAARAEPMLRYLYGTGAGSGR